MIFTIDNAYYFGERNSCANYYKKVLKKYGLTTVTDNQFGERPAIKIDNLKQLKQLQFDLDTLRENNGLIVDFSKGLGQKYPEIEIYDSYLGA